MNVCVIIPAAGRSSRFGESDKLGQDLGGRSVIVRTVELFTKRDEVRSIIVAGPPDTFDQFREKYGPTLGFHGAKLVPGGRDHRWESVRAGLEAVPDDATHIAVHDAARPGTSKAVFDRVFAAAATLDAVIPVVPINATVKRLGKERRTVGQSADAVADLILGDEGKISVEAQRIAESIDRTGLAEVQTPQVFSADLLRRAYVQENVENGQSPTDDAELVERLGEPVYAVQGDVRNIKITSPDDVSLLRAILGIKAPTQRPVHKRF